MRLVPPIEKVWPALTRCIEVQPARTTEYTLTAADAQGRSVSQSAVIEVGPPRATILEVSVNKLTVLPGEQVLICFKAKS